MNKYEDDSMGKTHVSQALLEANNSAGCRIDAKCNAGS